MPLVEVAVELGQAILPAGQTDAAVKGLLSIPLLEAGAAVVKPAALDTVRQMGLYCRKAEVEG